MTTQQPETTPSCEALRLADAMERFTKSSHWWTDGEPIHIAVAAELRSLHTENETLRAGYAAARQEIASLQAQLEAVATPAQPLHVAAISCPHEIDKDKIVLHFDSKQPGKNALAQLAARLQAAQEQPAVQTQRTGLCCRSHPHEKQGMQCQLLEVSAWLRWHASACTTPSADSMRLYADQVDAVTGSLLDAPAQAATAKQSPHPEYDKGFSDGWNRCEERQAAAPASQPFAYEFSRSNGDGTHSEHIERGRLQEVAPGRWEHSGLPRGALADKPIKALYTTPQTQPAAVLASGPVGFDHKTAANFLNGKTVTDEEMRRFVAHSRWAMSCAASWQQPNPPPGPAMGRKSRCFACKAVIYQQEKSMTKEELTAKVVAAPAQPATEIYFTVVYKLTDANVAKYLSNRDWVTYVYADSMAELANLKELSAEPAAPTQPVAWALQWPDDSRLNLSTVFDTQIEATDYLKSCSDGVVVVPLYAAPQPAAIAKLAAPIADLQGDKP